jgi:hypothetical protein
VSMVLIFPSFLINSSNIWPTMKFCPISLPLSWSNAPCPLVDKGLHIIVISL